MPRSLLVLLLLFLGFARSGTVASTAKSPWLGVWSATLGDYGVVALEIRDKGDGVPSGVAVWWLVDSPRVTGLRIEGDTLSIDILNHQQAPVPGIALRLTEQRTLRFADYGVLRAPLDPLYANAEFIQPTDDNPWYRITNTYYKTSEWGKWHESGRLKPLPAAWPTSVAAPLLRLFAHDVHLLYRVVVLPSLPEADLAAAYAWADDTYLKSNGGADIRRRLGQNPSTPLPLLTELWHHPDSSQLWIAAAQNPRAPAEWRAALVERILAGSARVQEQATWLGDGPPELYLRLIEKNPQVRARLAGNRDMPAAIYEKLARDHPQDSLRYLISNPAVPTSLLERVALSADKNSQLTLITNPSLPAPTRTRIVHQILAQATPTDFPRFAHDRDATPEFLARCAADLEPGIRTYVAQNPNTPETLLLTLAEDPSRPVAEAARAALSSRFPATFAPRHAGFTPLASRADDIPLYKQFENAIASADLATLRRLAAYYTERGELAGLLSQHARHVVAGGYRPAVMDLFLELGFVHERGDLAPLAGQFAASAQWLAYFQQHDVFKNPSAAARAYRAALESKEPAHLAALLAAGIDPNQPDGEGRTPLHLAILHNNLAAAETLVQHGAARTSQDRHRQTPLDYAVRFKSAAAIRLLDTDGRHTAQLAAFAKEFPPAPQSRFLGAWTNNRDGFNTVAIFLNPDGSGRIGAAVLGGLLAWRETGTSEATAFVLGENGQPIRDQPISLRLDPAGRILSFTPARGEAQRMTRQ